jgi:tRNA threonylcarbamoyladenosine biosynthesis protein TsaE
MFLATEEDTEALGAQLAKLTPRGGTWLLGGGLGAGKTTWTRGFVEGLGGPKDQVSSPTYAVLHSYDVSIGKVFHLDLYRLGPLGVWTLGLEDSVTQGDWLVAEWAGSEGPWPTPWVSFLDLAMLQSGRTAVWRCFA